MSREEWVIGRWGRIRKGREDGQKIRALEAKYRYLENVPDFRFATHGARPEHMIQILKRGYVSASPEEPSGLSMNQTVWGYPRFVYLIFPFENVKHLLLPTFYVRVPAFTFRVNKFYFCAWDTIHFTELSLETRLPIHLATQLFITRPHPELERLARERGLKVTSSFQTPLSRWAKGAGDFIREYSAIIPEEDLAAHVTAIIEYTPRFVRNYNLKLAHTYGIDWKDVEREEAKEMRKAKERLPNYLP